MRRVLTSDDHPTLRLIGGVLFGIGAFVLLIRRLGPGDAWGPAARFLILWIPAVILYGWGLAGARASARPSAWQSAFTVFGLVLIPVSLFLFLDWVGGNTSAPLNGVWIFLLSAGFGFVAGLAGRVRYCCLLASLMVVLAWLLLWDEILSGGLDAHDTASRWLLLAIGVILLLVAAAISMRRSDDSPADVITAAGLPMVLAGGITGLSVIGTGITFGSPGADGGLWWDIELLVVSISLLAYGVGVGVRGTTYVAALGLAVFAVQVSRDFQNLLAPDDVVGWPLVLLIAGGLALVVSALPALRRR